MTTIDEQLCIKILSIVDKGLVQGLGVPEPGKMCVEAAVSYALGLDHGDKPECVGEVVREFKIKLNDAIWPSDIERASGLRKLAIAQLGSNTIDQYKFIEYIIIQTVKRILPFIIKNDEIKTMCSKVETLLQAQEVIDCLSKILNRTLNSDKYEYNVSSPDASAINCVDIAIRFIFLLDFANIMNANYIAHIPNRIAACAGYVAISCCDSKILHLSAQIGLEALIMLDSPGCKFLNLCE
jgi:hypothetical protein